jgi:GNAT superfamily N-acetyltransferase
MVELRLERAHARNRRTINAGLLAFNAAAVGEGDFEKLTLTARVRGRIVGGLAAEMYFGWMFVSLLWIEEKHRLKGIGRSLMEKAEDEARGRDIRHVWLDTFGFQAERFYKKLGYREFGRLEDFPRGHSRVWLTKALYA